MRRVTNTIISSELIILKVRISFKEMKVSKKECNVVAFWKQFYKLCTFLYIFTYTAKDMTELWNFSSFFLWWYFLQKHVNKNAIWCIFFHISKKYKDLEFFRKIGCFIWRAANQLKILGSYLIKSNKYISLCVRKGTDGLINSIKRFS